MLGARFNFVIVILMTTFVVLQYRLWVEAGGVRDVFSTKENLARQEKQLAQLENENNKLVSQIDRLKNSKDAVESRARNELGMIKKGETFYQIVK